MSSDEAIRRAKLLLDRRGVRYENVILTTLTPPNEFLPTERPRSNDCWCIMFSILDENGQPFCPGFTEVAVDVATGEAFPLDHM